MELGTSLICTFYTLIKHHSHHKSPDYTKHQVQIAAHYHFVEGLLC